MAVEKIKQKLDKGFQKSVYITKPQNKGEENYFLQMKAEDAEIQRASQQSRDIYRLQLQAKHGNCDAIKKLISYNFQDFGLDSEFAQELQNESKQMLSEQLAIYTTSCGKLSDTSIEFAKDKVAEDDDGSMSDMEKAQEYNNLIDDMELGCSYL